MREQMKRVAEHSERTGEVLFNPPINNENKTTYVSIFADPNAVTKEFLDTLNLPFSNIHVETDAMSGRLFFEGEIHHPSDKYWHQCVDLYKSGYSATSYIVPFWGISDPIIIHLIILYALSIVVRYLPSLWHDIEDGELNHMRALIEHYLAIVDNVLPKLAVEAITGRRLVVVQPGSLHAPS